MTALAGHAEMRTVERESGAEVIEGGLRMADTWGIQSRYDNHH